MRQFLYTVYCYVFHLISNEWYTAINISIEDHGTIGTDEGGIDRK